MATVITTAIEKGGTGKTTTVVNIAALAAKDGKNVLVVDCDAQANSTYMLSGNKKSDNVYKGKGLYNMFRAYDEESDIDKFIHKTNVEGVDMIPSNAETPMAIGQLDILAREFTDSAYKFLAFCLAKVIDQYDYIIIDTPPTRDVMTISALYAADEVIIPCRCDEFSLDGLQTTIKVIDNLSRDEGMKINLLGIALTQVERTAVTAMTREEILESDFGSLLFNTMVRKGAAVADSTKIAQPVVKYAKSSNPAKDYQALYQEITERLAAREE